MADLLCTDVCIWISHIGCGFTRRALLGLEPGSRIWLEVEGKPILFERMQDGADGRVTRGLKPVGPSKADWRAIYDEYRGSVVDIHFVERPLDRGRSAERWCDDDIPAANGHMKNIGVNNG